MPPVKFAPPTEVPGLAARRVAADILDGVLHKRRTLDDQLEGAGAHPGLKSLSDRRAAKYAGLVNAVLRRCAREGQPLIDEVQMQRLDIPSWLMARWAAHYGETTAHAIALALSHEPSLDLTVKADAAQWAARLH